MGQEVVSELKVLKSNAGYYVGTTYTNEAEGEYDFPNSRDSGYFKKREDAEKHLETMVQ